MVAVLREKTIKSASRVLEILEIFDEPQRSVSVMEVARRLDYPQSSTSELLGCLVAQGYLVRDRQTRTYRPTARVALLGAWVQPSLFRDGTLLPLMDALAEDSGKSVVLASLVGVELKHVHVVGGQLPRRLRGATRHHPLHSPLGWALLSKMWRENVRKLVHRLNAESESEAHVRYADLAERLDQVSRQGYACGAIDKDHAAISVLLPQTMGDEQLALGIIASRETIEEEREALLRNLREAIAHHLGPTPARSGDGKRVSGYAA